jgi:SAM-dependent methyltransferase
MWNITLDGQLHLAPIGPKPKNVLDIGTGTGIWAVEFGTGSSLILPFTILKSPPSRSISLRPSNWHRSLAHPASIVSLVSLSQPINSPIPSVPPNCQFEIGDAEDEWIFPMKFDYIHGRTLTTCFADPASVIGKAYDAMVPGGYFELQDMSLQVSDDNSIAGTALEEWQTHVREVGGKIGRVWTNTTNYKRWMVEKGFEGVTEVKFLWPSNQWSADKREKLLGAWTQAQIDNGMLESVSTRLFMKILGWSKERLDEFLSVVKRDSKDPNVKAYSPM